MEYNNNNLPQGYKQTELGVIPEDWAIVSVDEVLDMPTKTISTTLFNHIYYVGTENMLSQKRGVSPYIGMLSYLQVREYLINDILTSNIRPYLKKIWLANKSGGCSSDVIVFRVKNNNEYYPEYIYTVLSDDAFFQYSMDNAIGTKMPRGDKNVIKAYNFVLPPLPEQKAIAEALSDVDDLITSLDKKIAKKRLIKQGAMQELLTGKKRLPGFEEEWEKKRLGDIGYTYSGLIGKTKNDFGHGNAKYITFLNVLTNPVLKESLFESVVVDDNEHQNKVQYGDLFFNTSSETPEDVGTCAVILSHQQNLYLNSFCFGYRLTDNNVLGLYLSYYFRSNNGRQLMTSLAQGATRYNLSKDLFNSSYITIPRTKDEQQAIATILSNMDKEIAELEAQRDKYRLVKSGMMQKLLTGEIRLKKPQASQILESKAIPVDAHIIAGHIVNRLYKSEGWGRTKLQKSLHLAGYYAQIYIGNEYIRNTAGPDDQRLMNYIDQQFRQFNHVKITRVKLNNGKIHYNYTPTSLIQEVEMAYEKYPENVRKQIDLLLDKMNVMDLDCAEILSTLYGVWNNRIIKSERITDDLLIADFYAWSKHKLEFDESRLRKALVYMREENIVPIGWGKYIDKKN